MIMMMLMMICCPPTVTCEEDDDENAHSWPCLCHQSIHLLPHPLYIYIYMYKYLQMYCVLLLLFLFEGVCLTIVIIYLNPRLHHLRWICSRWFSNCVCYGTSWLWAVFLCNPGGSGDNRRLCGGLKAPMKVNKQHLKHKNDMLMF